MVELLSYPIGLAVLVVARVLVVVAVVLVTAVVVCGGGSGGGWSVAAEYICCRWSLFSSVFSHPLVFVCLFGPSWSSSRGVQPAWLKELAGGSKHKTKGPDRGSSRP